MDGREQRVYEEAAALWREVFDAPPPVWADGSTLLGIITQNVDEAAYRRLHSPFLRPSTIVGPAQPRDDRQFRD